jgi:peptidoglycan/LPS O-acetylase OafA/YrhL
VVAPLVAARRAEYYAHAVAPARGCDGYDRRMRPILLVLGVLLIGAGAVFVAQGLDLPFAPVSFMTADRAWVLIGAIVVVAGVVLVGWSRQRGDAAPE